MKGTTMRLTAAAIATVVGLSGRSLLSGDDDAKGGSSASSSSGTVSGDENGAKEAGIDLKNPPKPMAKATFKPANDQDIDRTTIELLELRRRDNVMVATFRLTGEGRGNANKNAFYLLGATSFAPVFIDMQKLEKYKSIDDLTSDESSTTAPLGEPVFLFTAFPLPRDGVTSMDLRMNSFTPVIEDVPMPQ